MAGLIVGIAGGLGIIQNNVVFKKTDYNVFTRGISPGSVINTSAVKPGFFSGGIRAVTGMPWDHSLMYVGQSAGNMIRAKYPDLLGERVAVFQGKEIKLKSIPPKAILHEIVESGQHVQIKTLDDYNSDRTCMEAWSRPYTQQQLESILLNLYMMYDMPYDIGEVGSHIGILPNSTIKNSPIVIKTEKHVCMVSLRVCSSLMTYALKDIENIPNAEKMSPGNLHKYFVKIPRWSRVLFNTVPGK